MVMDTGGRLVAGSHNRNEFVLINADEIGRLAVAGQNDGVCHGCRRSGHFFADCQNKVPCPWCKAIYMKCFTVVKNNNNKSKLFKCCNKKCEFWEWTKEGETSGESSVVGNSSTNHVATVLENNVACMFETMCRLTHDKDVEIIVTILKRKCKCSH